MNDRNRDLDRLKNPPKLSEKDRGIKQVPFRLHRNDYLALKKLLKGDGWTFQRLVQATVECYMRRDPLLVKVLADWKEENVVPPRAKETYTLSSRERRGILDELEEMGDEL